MKSKAKRAGLVPLILSALALLLAVAAVWAAPAAVAKYAAMGQGTAPVQVAGWNVGILGVDGDPIVGGIRIFNTTTLVLKPDDVKTKTFTVYNGSDVTADITIVLERVDGDIAPTDFSKQAPVPLPYSFPFSGTPGPHAWRFAPYETRQVSIDFWHDEDKENHLKNFTYKIVFYAVQVD